MESDDDDETRASRPMETGELLVSFTTQQGQHKAYAQHRQIVHKTYRQAQKS